MAWQSGAGANGGHVQGLEPSGVQAYTLQGMFAVLRGLLWY